MKTELMMSTGDIESGETDFQITIKGNEESNLDLSIRGIQMLIESIDVKHACNEDYEKYTDALKTILLSIATSLECEGWEIEDESEEKQLGTVIRFLNNEGIEV